MEDEILLQLEHVCKYFYSNSVVSSKKTCIKAVDDVSLSIKKNQTIGLVGESGCGKTTLGRTILNLYPATSGKIIFEGKEIQDLSFNEMRNYRKEMQMIFQDPYASLSPRRTILQSLEEPLELFGIGTKKERREQAVSLLEEVGIMKEHLEKFPHELSGGQRQRIVVARSIILKPKFIIADEPVSALDVSVRSQVLNLMKRLQKSYSLSYLFISHDLSVVRYLCDRVVVMYLGKIVEIADKKDLFETPLHPYTQALISVIPVPDVDHKVERIILEGDLPSPANPPSGCVFRTRCKYAKDICSECVPELKNLGGTHEVACHFAGEI